MNMMMPTVMRMIKNVPLTLTRTRFSRAPALHTKTPPSLLVRSWQKNDRPRDDCTLYVCNSASISINHHQSVWTSIGINRCQSKNMYIGINSHNVKKCVSAGSVLGHHHYKSFCWSLQYTLVTKINRSNITSFLLIKDSKNHISISKVCWNYSQDWCQVLCKN